MSTDERAAEHAARDGARRLAQVIRSIDRKAKAALSTGLVIPVLDADPTYDDQATIWLLSDGRLRFYDATGAVQQVTSSATGSATSAVTTPDDPSPTRQVETYGATGAVTICEVHGVESGPRLGYGVDQGQHGTRRVVIMFDSPTIEGDLAGAVIRSVEISMLNTAATDERIEVAFGTHNLTSLPLTFIATRRNVFVDEWPAVGLGDEWRDAPVWIGEQLRDGGITGLTIDQPPGLPYLGEMDWSSVRIKITFTL